MVIILRNPKNRAEDLEIPSNQNLEIDCANKIVLADLIDCHVHFRVPGHEQKEDWKTGSAAAVAGGISTALDMPNNNPSASNQKIINQKKEVAAKDSLCNYGFFLGATPENAVEIERIQNAVAVKAYVGSSTGNLLVSEKNVLEKIFLAAKKRGLPVCVHAEDEATIQQNLSTAKKKDWNHAKYHSKIRTSEAEAIAIEACLKLQQKTGNQLHVCHVSSAAGLELVEKAKTDFPELRLSCEVSPNHLFFTEDIAQVTENFAKVNPSLKTKKDQQALWKGIRNGTIDCIATDHAPHLVEEKQQPYFEAPSGMPGIETMVPLLANAVQQEKLDWMDIERLCSRNPQAIFNFEANGCATIIDPNNRWRVQNEELHSKCQWSPFNGWVLQGKVETTVVNGTIVFNQGKIIENNRRVGKLVQRK